MVNFLESKYRTNLVTLLLSMDFLSKQMNRSMISRDTSRDISRCFQFTFFWYAMPPLDGADAWSNKILGKHSNPRLNIYIYKYLWPGSNPRTCNKCVYFLAKFAIFFNSKKCYQYMPPLDGAGASNNMLDRHSFPRRCLSK